MEEQMIKTEWRAISEKHLVIEARKLTGQPEFRIDIQVDHAPKIVAFFTGLSFESLKPQLFNDCVYVLLPEFTVTWLKRKYQTYHYTENQ